MELSNKALDKIKSEKKLYLNSYMNENKVPAIGYGIIRYPDGFMEGLSGNVKIGDKISKHDADALLSFQMKIYEECVDNFVRVPITQNQFDAMVLICYDIGIENFLLHPGLSMLNNFDYRNAIEIFKNQYIRNKEYQPSKKQIENREYAAQLFLS